MNQADVAAREFVSVVSPLLRRDGDVDRLREILAHRWPDGRLSELLESPDPIAAAAAARCVGCVGRSADSAALVKLLGHDDATVAATAEEALWRIWMRSGTRDGNARLSRAVELIGLDDLASAVVALEELVRREPEFAEAFHQLGIVYSLQDRLDESEAAFRRAVELNPAHFSAVANLGHVAANREDIEGAAAQYRKALDIYPRIEGLAEILAEIEAVIPPRW